MSGYISCTVSETMAEGKYLITLIDYPKLTERTIVVYSEEGFTIEEGGCLKIQDNNPNVGEMVFAPTRWLEAAQVPVAGKSRKDSWQQPPSKMENE